MTLKEVAEQLVRPGKGILAADESTPTVGKRLAKYDIENTEENRRDYRDIFLTAHEIGSYLSGCILYKETLGQASRKGPSFISVLTEAGILPGIKVDEKSCEKEDFVQGLEPIAEGSKESHTKGLKGLEERCQLYARQGAKFSKWRAALTIGEGTPSARVIETNAAELAKYASVSQRCGLVPIVEPEILIDGAHSIERSAEVAAEVFREVFQKLGQADVDLAGCLLKIQMIMPGSEAARSSPEEIAKHTLKVLTSVVPKELAGVVFLSGGQSEEEATVNLNAINKLAITTESKFWGLSFSYGRSLQASALEAWSKDRSSQENFELAQKLAVSLAAANAKATVGQYTGPHPSQTQGALKEAFRGWT